MLKYSLMPKTAKIGDISLTFIANELANELSINFTYLFGT